MEKLSLKKFEDKRIQNLMLFNGGCTKPTSWRQGDQSGKDTYQDNDGDCKLSSGDTVILDDGRVIIQS